MSHIKYIMEDQRPPNEHALGVLTTADRDKWATMRTQLCNAGNTSALGRKGLTLLHSERPKLHRVLVVLSAIGLKG